MLHESSSLIRLLRDKMYPMVLILKFTSDFTEK